MRIGILRVGRVNPRIVRRFGEYPRMAESLVAPEDAPGAASGDGGEAFEFAYWPVSEGVIPEDPAACDGWLVTGSRHSVYDPLPWIEPAAAFLRRAVEQERKVLGICFGHQLLAHALGGRVEKWPGGWGIGVQAYRVLTRPPWMRGAPDRVAFQAIHQDQVVVEPAGALRVASSDFCPSAMLAYGRVGFSVQAHPEFSREFSRSLLQAVRGDRIGEAACDRALATVDDATQEREFSTWARRFFRADYDG